MSMTKGSIIHKILMNANKFDEKMSL